MSHSCSLSFTLWSFLWCLQTFCQVNLRFVFLIMGLSTLLCKVLNLSMSSSLSLAASVCVSMWVYLSLSFHSAIVVVLLLKVRPACQLCAAFSCTQNLIEKMFYMLGNDCKKQRRMRCLYETKYIINYL